MQRPLLLFILIAAGCSPALSVPSDAVITCASGSACPSGLVCAGARCVSPELIDSEGPALVIPADRALTRAHVDIPFAWGLVTGAASYTLTIARDASFETIVFEMAAITDSQATATLDSEGTYYWRVTSDVTKPGSGATRVFGVIDTTVYVACDDDCTPRDDVIELGTPENPYRGIGRGAAAADAIGAHEVHVASRPADAAYTESFALPEGTMLLGGYTRDFTERTGRTLLTSPDVILDAFDIREATLVDGFTLRSAGADQSTVVRMSLDSEALSFSNVGFDAPLLLTPLMTVVSGVDVRGPRLVDCELTATAGVTEAAVVVSLSGKGALQLERTSVVANAVGLPVTPYPIVTALDVDTSTLTMNASSVMLQSSASVVGVRVRGAGTSDTASGASLSDCVMNLTAASDLTGIAITDSASARVVRSSVIAQSTSTGTIGAVQVINATDIAITDSVFVIRAWNVGGWFEGFNAKGILAGNTVVLASATGPQGAISLITGARPGFANNLVIASGVSATYPAFYQNQGQAIAVVDNTFVGFGCQYKVDGAGSCATLDAAISPYEFAPAFAGNTFETSLVAVGLASANGVDGVLGTSDDDYHPAAGSALAAHGVDPTSDACTPPRPSDPSKQAAYDDLLRSLASPTCGGGTTDLENRARPTPPAIGAFEPR